MANNSWAVETEKLTSAASVIREKTEKYKADYGKLYTELQSLKSSQWQGVASDAFNTKLDGYKTTFEELEKVLLTFAEGLDTRAKNYEDTETAVKDAADAL